MDEVIKRVEGFHEKFGIPVGQFVGDVTKGQQALHYKLMLEELNEFKDACDRGDVIGVADGLGDILFVLLSSVVAHGLHHNECFKQVMIEICNSNDSKLDKDNQPVYREDGKIMKSDIYFPPNIKAIIGKHMGHDVIKDQIENI